MYSDGGILIFFMSDILDLCIVRVFRPIAKYDHPFVVIVPDLTLGFPDIFSARTSSELAGCSLGY